MNEETVTGIRRVIPSMGNGKKKNARAVRGRGEEEKRRRANVGNVRLIVRPAVIFLGFVHKSIKNLPGSR